jgi:AcrR family transcriptional regulator
MSRRAYSSSIRDAQVEQTRAHLMDTARLLLVEGGLDALTLPRLAQAAKVSVPTVYRHFPTVDDLFRAFLAWMRPRIGMTQERLAAMEPEQIPQLPLENYPRYEAEAALLRPLMDSREFSRVRQASVSDRAKSAAKQLRSVAPGWSEAELQGLAGAVWALGSPQAWRWLRDTWGLDNDAAARASAWAIGALIEALRKGPPASKPARKPAQTPRRKR